MGLKEMSLPSIGLVSSFSQASYSPLLLIPLSISFYRLLGVLLSINGQTLALSRGLLPVEICSVNRRGCHFHPPLRHRGLRQRLEDMESKNVVLHSHVYRMFL